MSSLVAVAVAVVLFFFSSCLISWRLGSAQATVTHLPRFDGPLPFHLETGYVEVDEVEAAQMFYYFVKSEGNPAEDPLVVWHSGGPACSTLSALVLEIGPLRLDIAAYNEGKSYLVYNPYTWTKTNNIIFIDAPIGTGFSYSKASDLYPMSDTKSALQLYTFIAKWLSNHPEFLTNPLYVGGDSYAGKIVPMIAQNIANGNQAGNIIPLNLKGYFAGNPPMDPRFDNSQVEYVHGMGLISDEVFEFAKQNCSAAAHFPYNIDCIESTLTGINWANILEPPCAMPYRVDANVTDHVETFLPVECRNSTYYLIIVWANLDEVRDALKTHKGGVKYWARCNNKLQKVYSHDVSSALTYHQDVTSRGYRALLFSGDHDMMVPHIGTQASIRSLNFSIVDHWRPWFVKGAVGGYTEVYSDNMTYATVKGAGHAAPEYKPEECQAMFSRWVSNAPL